MTAERLKLTAAALALVASTTLALPAQRTLKVGDPAPKLQTGKWIQGEPVKSFEKGKAYLVEFWANLEQVHAHFQRTRRLPELAVDPATGLYRLRRGPGLIGY